MVLSLAVQVAMSVLQEAALIYLAAPRGVPLRPPQPFLGIVWSRVCSPLLHVCLFCIMASRSVRVTGEWVQVSLAFGFPTT